MSATDSNDVFDELAGLGVTLWRVLESATDIARHSFDRRDRMIEPSHFANLTRYEARFQLEVEGYDLLDLPNNGIQIEYRGYSIKVLKFDDGDLPIPGQSRTKRCFYQQVLPFKNNVDVILPPSEHRNLIVCWDVDGDHMVSDLTLFSPLSGNEHSARAKWSRPIPHPGDSGLRERIEMLPSQLPTDDDLDITLRYVTDAQTGTDEDD